jgi:UDP-N-acetylglucosamine 4-epimerase
VFARCYGLPSIGLRYFNVFGPRQDPQGAYAAVIPRWIAAMLRDETCTIYGDGESSRDFCFVANAVQANLRAAFVSEGEALNQVYNIAVGARTTLKQLHDAIGVALAPVLARATFAIRSPISARLSAYSVIRPRTTCGRG